VVAGDLLTGSGLEAALDGCASAYYLVHSMEQGSNRFESRDRQAASNFVLAARAAGLERAVYLGGILPADGPHSAHLRSRLEVEEILLEGLPRSTALRASIVIGAQSSSFRILVRLVERLRVMPFPAWHAHSTRAIAERDAVEYLALTPQRTEAEGRSLDIGGPDTLSYGRMIERIADLLGVGRLSLRLPINQTPAASAVVSAVVDQPVELVRPLMESLEHDLLPRDEQAASIFGVRPLSFDRAVERALAAWERNEELAAR
ncbi:MAG: epimerase, partial [Actinomycetota bacterium]|nr:epimerase [Actinomycetota bacterium]